MIRHDRKRKRSAAASSPKLAGQGPRGAVDWFVALPKKTSAVSNSTMVPQKVMINRLLARLHETGFEQVALTHTVYGRPGSEHDRVDTAIPVTLWEQEKKKNDDDIRVLRRLHVVVENLSDVGFFGSSASSSPTDTILNGYDLVSLSPRNEAAFQAACSSAVHADIITLDITNAASYFKIRATDVKAAIANNIVFEFPYAAAVLNRSLRKALVQLCREFQMASLGLKQSRVIFSSASRHLTEDSNSDLGPMALRTAGDLANLLQVVLGFDSRTASHALSVNGQFALERARKRRFGDRAVVVTKVSIESSTSDFANVEKKKISQQSAGTAGDRDEPSKLEEQRSKEDGEEDRDEDGFIAF